MSFAEIATAAGISRGLPTHYFGSKEALIIRLLVDITEQYSAAQHSAEFEAASGLNKLVLYIQLYLTRAKARPGIARALQLIRAESLISTPGLQQALAETNNVTIALITGAIHSGQAAGEIKPDVDADTYALLVIGALRGLVGQYLTAPKQVDIDALSEEFSSMIVAQLAVKAERKPRQHKRGK